MGDGVRKYRVDFSPSARKIIDKLDKKIRKRISDWIANNLTDCENPRFKGKPLHGNLKGKWRYRVGDYRLIAEIHDDEIIILIIDVDKRNDVYKD